ncbi:MAG: hypothetical protein Ta2G_17810 [Termitinemataceae bacterium]|nr:MAG: hypothetical protein Ta2G_17810 [Termitinemataceae bacterium]
MDDAVTFKSTAFKHGVEKTDIYNAFDTFIYEEPMEDFINKYLLLGFDTQANLLEIMYNRINVDTINVFHAMPCRKAWRDIGNI